MYVLLFTLGLIIPPVHTPASLLLKTMTNKHQPTVATRCNRPRNRYSISAVHIIHIRLKSLRLPHMSDTAIASCIIASS